MAKSIRSKIKKRLRTAKRQRIDAMIVVPRLKEHHEALTRVAQGRTIETRKPKNAFKYPKAPDAVFPQHEIMKPIDFRAQNLPMAGYAFRGNRRKYDADQAEFMTQVATAMHPKMERLAGGGAVLASTGKRISVAEAELIAAHRPRPKSGATKKRGKRSAAEATEAYRAAAATAAAPAAPKPAAPQAAALQEAAAAPARGAADGDAEMTPVSSAGQSMKVKKKAKRKTKAA
ncbi:unnamed protein product [Prorocentrum cordatum]|uniref:Ribosome biogenesis protein NOP53 n=1 Tax=Prorocentrum cordatum TaxID=2364126 RepID=A0ABN9RXR3_9DINO|nr:unnamed protein product [Polarella glacialis]